jgi:hypothetical protein
MKDVDPIITINPDVPLTFTGEKPTLRDQFAMAALTGLIADTDTEYDYALKEIPVLAYDYADEMLKAREAKA